MGNDVMLAVDLQSGGASWSKVSGDQTRLRGIRFPRDDAAALPKRAWARESVEGDEGRAISFPSLLLLPPSSTFRAPCRASLALASPAESSPSNHPSHTRTDIAQPALHLPTMKTSTALASLAAFAGMAAAQLPANAPVRPPCLFRSRLRGEGDREEGLLASCPGDRVR